MNRTPLLTEILHLLHELDREKREILPTTRILVELDLDSLQMLDLVETLNKKYGIDFFSMHYSLDDLRTPESLTAAIAHFLSSPDNAKNASEAAPS